MQDNPPAGDGPAPQPSDDQMQADQRPPAAERPAADPGAAVQEPTSATRSDARFDLNAVGLDTAQRLYTSDTGGQSGNGADGQASPFGKQFEQARAQFRRQPGREPLLHWDYWARYERGLALLTQRISLQDPAFITVSALELRLRENIALVRSHGDDESRRSGRSQILEQLNYQSIQLIQTPFETLCAVGDIDANDSNGASKVNDTQELPKTQRGVADWYTTKLGWQERCYVIATCALRGAPSHEVSRASHELYTLIEQAYPVQQAAPNAGIPTDAIVGPAFISADDLLARTYTVERTLEGAKRIMWRDEAFDPLVREYLARQATTVGMRFGEQNLLDILEGWAVSDDEERAFRAARTLADLWWRQHQDKVLELAETWAASDEPQIWQGGAALMYGAYAAERAEQPDMKAADSKALRLLHDWSDWRDDDEGLALVATYSYGLIGRQWPEAALDGLDYLLCLGEKARKNNTIPPLPILFLTMLSYVEMASSGQIRSLLKRFARHAEYYALRARDTSHGLIEPAQSRGARERSLEMLFFHFVFLAALSMSGVRKGGSAHMPYLMDVGLLPYPDMPSARGQDVLLAGVLSSQEPEWRANLMALLCAAISTGREQLAFDLLASWIHIVTFEPRTQALDALHRFVFDLHRQLDDWDRKVQKGGLRAGAGALTQRLRVWSRATRENVLRPFALRALDALHA